MFDPQGLQTYYQAISNIGLGKPVNEGYSNEDLALAALPMTLAIPGPEDLAIAGFLATKGGQALARLGGKFADDIAGMFGKKADDVAGAGIKADSVDTHSGATTSSTKSKAEADANAQQTENVGQQNQQSGQPADLESSASGKFDAGWSESEFDALVNEVGLDTKTLYHGGDLVDGMADGIRPLSTTDELWKAQQHADGGAINQFDIPNDVFKSWDIPRGQDTFDGLVGPEYKIPADLSDVLNKYKKN